MATADTFICQSKRHKRQFICRLCTKLMEKQLKGKG